MKQKIVQIATIAGDHSTDRGLYALTDAGNLYCIGSDSVWIKLPDLPCNLPNVKVYKEPVSHTQAFKEGCDCRRKHGIDSYELCPYEHGSDCERYWISGFKG